MRSQDATSPRKRVNSSSVHCAANPVACGKYVLWSGVAWSWAKDLALQNNQGWVDNIYDAYRHAAWSAALTISFNNPLAAFEWTEAREWSSRQAESTCMDRYNNAIGREIGVALGPSASWVDIKAAVLARTDLQTTKACNDYY